MKAASTVLTGGLGRRTERQRALILPTGMSLRQMRCGFQVARGQRDDSIPMDELAVETAICTLPFGPLDPANALDNRQPCGDLNACDLRNKDVVTGLITLCIPRL